MVCTKSCSWVFVSVCFGVKYFLKNVFGILRCLVGAKIIINENHFQFDHKYFFQFLENDLRFSFAVLKTVNHFLNLNSSFLPSHL